MAGVVKGLGGQGPGDGLHPQGLDGRPIHHDGGGVLLPVPLHQAGAHRRGVAQAQIHQSRPGVVEQGLYVVRGGHALGLPVLGHDVADVRSQRVGGTHRVGNAVHQQVGDDAGVKAAGAQEDQLRLPDGPHRLRQGLWVLGQQADALTRQSCSFLKALIQDSPSTRWLCS